MATVKTKKTSKPTRRVRASQKVNPNKPVVSKKAVVPPKLAKAAAKQVVERPQRPKLPHVMQLTRTAYRLLAGNWKLFVGIAVVYGVLNILLVRGLNGGLNVTELKTQLSQAYSSGWGNFASGFTVFALLVSSSNSGSGSDAASAYQSFLVLITSLALVWAFRQLMSDTHPNIRIRDAFYKGMYPLIPVILVLLVIGLQLIPMLLGGLLFTIVISNGIAVTAVEVSLWAALFIASIVCSLLLITPSIFGLYIASLPDMTPLKALRSAKTLVRFRRWTVLRKLLFLPILVFLLLSAIILPIIFVIPVLAQWVFFGLSTFVLPAIHAYLYTLYRELLHD